MQLRRRRGLPRAASTSTLAKWTDWAQFDDNAKQRRPGRRRQDLRRPDGHRHPRALVQQGRSSPRPACRRDVAAEDLGRRARARPARSRPSCPTSSRSTSTPARPPARRASMQGFEMLLYGTGRHALRHRHRRSGSPARKGFKDSLNFVKTVYGEKLGPGTRPGPRRQRRQPRLDRAAAPGQARHRARRLLAARSAGSRAAPRRGPSGSRRSASPRCPPRTARHPGSDLDVGRLAPRPSAPTPPDKQAAVRLHRRRPQHATNSLKYDTAEQPDRRAQGRRRGPEVPRRQPVVQVLLRARAP